MQSGMFELVLSEAAMRASSIELASAGTPSWRIVQAGSAYSYADLMADVERSAPIAYGQQPPTLFTPQVALATLLAHLFAEMAVQQRYAAPWANAGSDFRVMLGMLLSSIAAAMGNLSDDASEDDDDNSLPLIGFLPLACRPALLSGRSAASTLAPMAIADAISIMASNFPAVSCEGLIGPEQLRRAAAGCFGPTVARAAQLLLDNPTIVQGMRVANERVNGAPCVRGDALTLDALKLGARLATSVSSGMDSATALRILVAHFDKVARQDGDSRSISMADLAATANDPLGSEVARAAARIREDTLTRVGVDVAFEGLAGRRPARGDDRLSRIDMLTALRATPLNRPENDVLAVMAKYQYMIWRPGEQLTLQQIREMSLGGCMPDGSATPHDLQVAMHGLLRAPSLFERLDSASYLDALSKGNGSAPGRDTVNDGGAISLADFRAVLAGAMGRSTGGRPADRGGRIDSDSNLRRQPGESVIPSVSAWSRPVDPQSFGGDSLGGSIALALISNMRSTGADSSTISLLTSAVSMFHLQQRATA